MRLALLLFLFVVSSLTQAGPHHHHHAGLDISSWSKQPTIEIKLHPDEKKGYNLQLITENFEFAPHNVNKAHQANQGHAHLYINDTKITRLYSNWFYIADLRPGVHKIRVELNGNDHSSWLSNGAQVAHQVEVHVQ